MPASLVPSFSVFALLIGPFRPVVSAGLVKRRSFLAIGPSCLSFQLGRFEGVVSVSGLSWVLNPAGLNLAVLFNYLGMQIYFGPLMLNGKFSTASNPKWNFGLCLLLPLRGLLQPR